MPVKKHADGHRSVESEIEVPGTPEQVWQAIATGPGVSSWFVPSEIEEREGGRAVSHFSPDNSMDSVGTITEWQPPHRYVVSTNEGPPGEVASEWIVEVRDGGTCVVRVVHRWFASSDDWDAQFEGYEQGWPAFFRILRLYLAYFPGQRGASFQLMGVAPEPKERAWADLARPLSLLDAAPGDRVATPDDAPPMTGAVEWAGVPDWPEELLIRLETPGPGLAHLFPMPMSGKVYLTLRFYFYGDDARAAIKQAQPLWQTWIGQRFPFTQEMS